MASNNRKMDTEWFQKMSSKKKASLFVRGLKSLRSDCENPEKRVSNFTQSAVKIFDFFLGFGRNYYQSMI